MKWTQHWLYWYRSTIAALLCSSSLLNQWLGIKPALAADTKAYCWLPPEAIAQKDNLRQSFLKGNPDSQNDYKELLRKHAERLRQCHSSNWPRIQSIWLRLYPCDLNPGALDEIMDNIVNRGYNEVYVEAFANGQVMLPQADNRTVWPSMVRSPGSEKADLLALAIQKGHERGLRVYAWMFTMNFGYTYAQRSDRQSVLARNGRGESSLAVVPDGSQVFIDPYNKQAKIDYYRLVEQVIQRRPDGILFDYIRYPRLSGADSVVTKVQNLWIYSDAALQALYQRALNKKGLELIRRFVNRGYINLSDIEAVDKLYPQEGSPLWQGRNPPPEELKATLQERQTLLQWDLWQLVVAHAAQGVVDFLALASLQPQQQGIPVGAVFFPDGNQVIGQGYDSRVQPWNRFPSSLEWHPMSYGNCGSINCITPQVQRVLSMAQGGTQIIPALAGDWGKSYNDRPSLEAQMQSIHQAAPQINAVSHFAYSWQEPEGDRQRKFCRR